MSKKNNEHTDPEEIKKKAGLFWRFFSKSIFLMAKGLFRLIIPRKFDKQHIIISLVVILGLVLLFIFFIEPFLKLVGTILLIAAIIIIIGGLYMFLTGKNPTKKE